MMSGKFKWTSTDSAGVVICLALTAATAWLGFMPIWNRHVTYLQNQHELQNKRQDAIARELTLKTSEKKLANTQLELNAVPLHLKPTAELNQRLASVTNLAAEQNLKIEDIAPGVTTKGKRFDAVEIHVEGEGSYPACATFLHHLNQSMPDIGIQTLHILSQGNAATSAKFTFDLQWFASPSSNLASVQ
jgi:Tfp pilus assembly protein PilO